MSILCKREDTMDTEKPVLQIEVPLADERNPSHALCPTCKDVQPIESFTRRPTKLQFRQWWGELPYERTRTYIGKECNACAKRKRSKKNTFDYYAYEETLRLDPKNHVLVPNRFAGKGTPKNPAPTADHIPLYVALVWKRRMQGRLRLSNARIKNVRNRSEPQYKALILLLRKECNRIKMRIRNGASESAVEFCKAYIEHLVWIAKTVQAKREVSSESAKDSPLAYVNDDRPETQRAKAAYRKLTSKDAELIKPRYL